MLELFTLYREECAGYKNQALHNISLKDFRKKLPLTRYSSTTKMNVRIKRYCKNMRYKRNMKSKIFNEINQYKGIITLIEKQLYKIKNKSLQDFLFILVHAMYWVFSVCFLVLPFISYNNLALKIICTVIWVIGVVAMGDIGVAEKKKDKMNIYEEIGGCTFWTIFLGVIFVNNNYYRFGELYQVILIDLLMLVGLIVIISYIVAFIKTPRITLAASCYILILLIVFAFFCFSMYLKNKGNDNVTIVVMISMFSTIALLAGRFVWSLLKGKKFRHIYVYASLILVVVGILLGISYVLHYLDNKISFIGTFITLLAATLGGGLTVLGVAWTLKNNHEERERIESEEKKQILEQQRMKYYPHIKYIDGVCDNAYKIDKLGGLNLNDDVVCKELTNKRFFAVDVGAFTIKNISEYPICIRGIQVGNKQSKSQRYVLLEPNEQITITMIKKRIYDSEIRNFIYLLIEDRLGNKYRVKCAVAVERGRVHSFKRGELTGLLKTYVVKNIYRPILIEHNMPAEQNSDSDQKQKN